jgi:hypothetical protein
MSEQIHARISAGKKAEWKEHKDSFTVNGEEKYNSFTDLIREAVDNQIARDKGQGGESPDFDMGSIKVGEGGKIDELLSAVERVESRVDSLDTDVSQAVDAVHAQEGVDPDIVPDVLEQLPDGRDNAEPTGDIIQRLSNQYNAAQVRFALEDLQRNAPTLVGSFVPAEQGGEGATYGESYARHWYSEGGE